MTPRDPGLALLLPVLLAPLAVQAASHPCASEPDAGKRLACYDSAFPLSPQVQEVAREQARARFGLTHPNVAPGDSGQALGVAEPERIESKVASVEHSGGLREFRLENGQAWRQVDTRSGGHVQPGDEVQVRKAVLAGYQLRMPNGVSVRVRRTR